MEGKTIDEILRENELKIQKQREHLSKLFHQEKYYNFDTKEFTYNKNGENFYEYNVPIKPNEKNSNHNSKTNINNNNDDKVKTFLKDFNTKMTMKVQDDNSKPNNNIPIFVKQYSHSDTSDEEEEKKIEEPPVKSPPPKKPILKKQKKKSRPKSVKQKKQVIIENKTPKYYVYQCSYKTPKNSTSPKYTLPSNSKHNTLRSSQTKTILRPFSCSPALIYDRYNPNLNHPKRNLYYLIYNK